MNTEVITWFESVDSIIMTSGVMQIAENMFAPFPKYILWKKLTCIGMITWDWIQLLYVDVHSKRLQMGLMKYIDKYLSET